MITLGLVANVDTSGVYVTMPGARGVLRGPYETLQNVTAGDKVLIVTTDDGENVIVGQAAAAATGVITSGMIADGTIVNADINAAAAIDRSKITGLPTSSTDNTVPRFDGTGGALQTSGVTVDDSNFLTSARSNIDTTGAEAILFFLSGGSFRWKLYRDNATESGSNAGSNLRLDRRADDGSLAGNVLAFNRATGKVTIGAPGSTAGLEFGSSGPRIMAGTGSPESVVSAPVGSLWLRTDSSTTLYVKQTGTGNTGWVAK